MKIDYMAAISSISDAWDEVCPDNDQGYVMVLVKDYKADGMGDKDVCRVVVSSLYDGLAYGNWPSVKF